MNKKSRFPVLIFGAILSELILVHIFLLLWWIVILLLIIGFISILLFHYKEKLNSRVKRVLYNTSLLFLIFFIAWIFRILVFDVYQISSVSMERCLKPGSVVICNKLSLGPLVPDLLLNITRGKKDQDDESTSRVPFRLKGYKAIQNKDLIILKDPETLEVLIKRCIGEPGDTIEIKNGKLYINHRPYIEPQTVQMLYRIYYSDTIEYKFLLGEDQVPCFIKYDSIMDTQYLAAYLNASEKEYLLTHNNCDSIVLETERKDSRWRLFPYHAEKPWTLDNFGPFVVPKKGMTIALTKDNWVLYRLIINGPEKGKTGLIYKELVVDSLKQDTYSFENDYYFMLGDNRHLSRDSRYFGPVPSYLIIAKVFKTFNP